MLGRMHDTDPTHRLGLAFEKHVMRLLERDFEVIGWMGDGRHTKDEVDFSPDIVAKNRKTGAFVGVECKFRSTHFLGRIAWAKEYQLKKYGRFREEADCPLFIVIGLGGVPDKPDYMYAVPLWQATHNQLKTNELKRYRRNPLRPFEWHAGLLA